MFDELVDSPGRLVATDPEADSDLHITFIPSPQSGPTMTSVDQMKGDQT